MAIKPVEVIYKLKDRFTAGVGKIATSLKGIGSQSDQTTAKLERNNKRTAASFSKLNLAALKLRGGIAAAFTSIIGGLGISSLIQTNREVERLRASLVTVTGSATEARKAWEQIKTFTSQTPFELNQVVEAFIKLKSLGLDPSEDALRSYGNTASAMGKDLIQLIEAVADASTGEFERLKEFGIKAKKEGDRVIFTFRGVKTEVGNNAEEIQAFLKKLGDTEFAGGMERQTRTLGGAISNLKDSWNNFLDAVLSDESSGALSRFIGGLTNQFNNLAKSISGGDVASLEAELLKLEKRLNSGGGGRNKGALRKRIKELKDEIIAAKVEAGDVSGIQQAISNLDRQLTEVETKLATFPEIINQRTGRNRGAAAKVASRLKAEAAQLKKEREDLQKLLAGIQESNADSNTTALDGAAGQTELIKERLDGMKKSLQDAKTSYDNVIQEFQGRLDQLKAPDQKPDEELNVLDADKGLREAERELRAGNFDRAIDKARQAFDVLERMKKAGVESEQIIEHFGERLQEVAEKAQTDKIADIEAQIKIDENKSNQNLALTQAQLQAQANANPIEQPVITVPVGGAQTASQQPQIFTNPEGNSFTDEPQPGFQPAYRPSTPEEMIIKARLDTKEADKALEEFRRRASQPIERTIYTNEARNSFSDRPIGDFGQRLRMEALGSGSRR